MAINGGEIKYKIGADKKDLDKGLVTAMGSIKTFVAKAAILGGVFKFFKTGVQAASDYGEAQDSLNRLIGSDGTKALEKFAATASKTSGLSQKEVLETANQFAGLFQTIPKGAIDTGNALVQLEGRVSDLGSQFNKSNDEIFTGLQSALSGRVSLTLQQMGIDLSQTALQTRIATGEFENLGISHDTSMSSLTSGQAVLLRYTAFMNSTQKSTGNFSQTLGISLPNQIKKMKSEFTNAAATLTQAWLPTITKVVSMLAKMGEFIGNNKVLVTALAGAFAGFKLGNFLFKIGQAIAQLIALGTAKAAAQGGIAGLITGGAFLAGITAMVGGVAGAYFAGGSGSSNSVSTSTVAAKKQPIELSVTMTQNGEVENASSNSGTAIRSVGNLGKSTM